MSHSLYARNIFTFTTPSPFDYISLAQTVRFPKELIQMTAQRIETGTNASDTLGFSEQLFSGWLEMYEDNRLYLHYIISRDRNEGHTQALLHRWLLEGYDVRVVMPRPIMQHILKKFQFVPTSECLSEHYEDYVEVWCRPQVGQQCCPPLRNAVTKSRLQGNVISIS